MQGWRIVKKTVVRCRGRSLAWTRMQAWGACDPGFKSRRPHHYSGSQPFYIGPKVNHEIHKDLEMRIDM
jgi:hypothetical protein